MTRIDFYVLRAGAARPRRDVVCSLTHKAWKQGQRVYLHADGEAEAARLDDELWTWRDVSFLPHVRAGDPLQSAAPILVGHADPGPSHSDVLINLHPEVPTFFARFSRVLEVVDETPEVRNAGRARYRIYQERGYPLEVHELGSAT